MTKNDFFTSKTDDEQKFFIKNWFLNNYENPANCCPYEEGEYVYIWGGPYEPKEELEKHFSGYVTQEIINEVSEELEDISYEWSDIPDNDEEELNYYINNSNDPYSNYLKTERDIKELINDNINNTKILYKMLYAQCISALEQFLSSYFIMCIKNNDELCRKFVKSCDELKNIKFEKFIESKKSISEYCCMYILKNIVWHKIKAVKKYYKDVLDITFPDEIPSIYQGIEKRHHIVHRNGKDFENNDIQINKQDIFNLLNAISDFIEKIIDIQF
ncbi:MAG: hypothetical protein PUF61_02355 [Spirochaetales bacterium]|nr:hypothetical protein [Spirochaetales bacterium]